MWELIQKLDEYLKSNWPLYAGTRWPGVVIIIGILSTAYNKSKSYLKSRKLQRIFKGYVQEQIKDHTKYYITHIGTSEKIKNGKPFNVIRHFKRKVFPHHDNQKHFLILGDSGTGKTSLLMNIIVKSTRLLSFKKRYLAMIPISTITDQSKFLELSQKHEPEDTILLLDALDEDTMAAENFNTRLKELFEWTRDFRKVIITCRTQFFPSDWDIPDKSINSYTDGRKLLPFIQIRLQPFTEKEVKKYLRKRYRLYKVWRYMNILKRQAAKKLIFSFPDISSRPLFLSFINDLLPNDKNVLLIAFRSWFISLLKAIKIFPKRFVEKVKVQNEKAIDKLYSQSLYSTKTKIYKAIVQKWIERETNDQYNVPQQKQQVALFRLAMCTALLIYEESKTNNKLSVPRAKVYEYAKENRIELPEIEINSRSLLFRDANGDFIFAHKSILEFFLAINGCEHSWLVAQLIPQPGWDNFNYFLKEITIIGKIYPFLKESHQGKIEFKFDTNEPYLKYPDISVEQVTKMVSLKITGDVGHINPTFFYALENISIEGYYNVARYLIYDQHYCVLEVQDLINFLLQNNDDNWNMLQRVIDIYEYYRLYKRAAEHMEKYIEFTGRMLQDREFERLLEFYKNDRNKEKFLPLRKKAFLQLTARHYRLYFYLKDLFELECHKEVVEEFETYKSEFNIDVMVHDIAACSYLKLDNVGGAIQCYTELTTHDKNASAIVNKIIDYYIEKNEFEKGVGFLNTCFSHTQNEEQLLRLNLVMAKLQFKHKGLITTQLIKQPLNENYKGKEDYYHDVVVFYKQTCQYNAAIELALELIKIDADNFVLINQAAICYEEIKDYPVAVKYFLTAIDIMEKNPEEKDYLHHVIYQNLAGAFEYMNQYEDSIAYYEKAIAKAPPKDDETEKYLESLAACFLQVEKWEAAFNTYRRLFARSSYDTFYLRKMIKTSLKTGNAEDIYRVYCLMNKIRNGEKGFLDELYQSLVDYFVNNNVFALEEEKIVFADAVFNNYYNRISREYLEI